MADGLEDIPNLDNIVKHLVVKPNGADNGGQEDEPVSNGKDSLEGEREAPPAKAKVQEETPREVPGEGEESAPVEEPVNDDFEDDDQIDVDTIELEVKVDGEIRKVPISELKRSYSAEGAIDKRLEEATQGRSIIQRQSQELHEVLGHSVARLQALDQVLEQAQQTGLDMEQLRRTDPTKWLFEKERQREIETRRARVQHEAQRLEEQRTQMGQAAMLEYTRAEYGRLAKAFPELADPKTKKQTTEDLHETAKYYNYTPQEVDAVRDHRAILVLRDAMKWRKHQAKQSKLADPEVKIVPKPLLKPGVKKSTTQTREAREMKALRATALKTGKPDDVAATLLTRGRTPRR